MGAAEEQLNDVKSTIEAQQQEIAELQAEIVKVKVYFPFEN